MPQMQQIGQGVGYWLFERRFLRTTKIMWFLAAFLLAIWSSGHGVQAQPTVLVLCLLAGLLVVSRSLVGVLAALVLGLALGLVRGHTVALQTSAYNSFIGQQVELQAVVASESTFNKFGQREFDVENVVVNGHELPGIVSVSAFGLASVERGDHVLVRGKLSKGFGSRAAYVRFAEISVLTRSGSPLASVRRKFFAATYSAIPEPQASLGLGFLVGGRTFLPADLLNALSITGLTHIVAVSGYNLTILVRLTRRVLARRSRYQAAVGSVCLVLGFLAITGLSPSVFRASVVTLLALATWYYGRKINPLMLLLLSGVFTAGVRPYYIWNDLGWWLSFLAFFGVLIVAPLITRRLYGTKKPNTIIQIIVETTSAQLLTMPLIGSVFGEFSLISIFANAVVLPLIPLAMLFTFGAGLAGMFTVELVGWFSWPARLVLELITSLVTILSNVPRALLAVDISTFEMMTMYGFICMMTLILFVRLKNSNQRLNGAEVIE